MAPSIVQQSNSQLRLGVGGTRDVKNLVKTDGQYLVFDGLEHLVSLSPRRRGTDIDSKDIECFDGVVERLCEVVAQPLISRFESQDVALVFEFLSMDETLP